MSLSVSDGNEALFILGDSLATPSRRAETTYDPTAMRWWRLRPEAGVIVGEYSADGRQWTRFGESVTAPPSTSMSVSLNAGNFQTIAAAQSAEFDNFNVCPP